MAGPVQATKASTRLRRIKHLYAKYGWLSLFRRSFARVAGLCLAGWRRIARHRNHVFVYDQDSPSTEPPAGLTVLRLTSQAELPDEIRAAMRARIGDRSLETDRWELDHGGVQWISLIDGEFAASAMSRKGRHFAKWFVELENHDVVIFRNVTVAEHRGKGICPATMREIIAREVRDGAQAYVDCRVYNRASLRSIEKAGFRRIATMKPLRQKEAIQT